MTQEAMRPCPFCGKSDTTTIGRASDVFWDEDDGPYPHSESFSVLCNAAKPDGPGGCGASGGYFPTEDAAIAAWNRRAQGAAPTGEALAMRELCASIAEEMRPAGGRAWTLEQKACYEALTACAENIRAITEAAPSNAEGPKPDGWRTIESAPKDGSLVLLFGEWAGEIAGHIDGISRIEIGYWDGGESDFPGVDWWYLPTGDTYACWMKATHWQPLPAPPSSSQEGA